MLIRVVIVVGGLGLLVVIALALSSAQGRKAPSLGVTDARLSECPGTSNCVSSQATNPMQHVESLKLNGPRAMARLRAALEELPRTRVVEARDGYLRVECRTLVFRWTDDLELWQDHEAGVVHVRSASRVGSSDLGANRRRVELLRSRIGDG